jgi:hypothetical protein
MPKIGFIVTFCGTNFWYGILMRSCRIAKLDFLLQSRKVTMNLKLAILFAGRAALAPPAGGTEAGSPRPPPAMSVGSNRK